MNLLNETILKIQEAGLLPSDVSFIGSADGSYECSWSEYEKLANHDYHDGYGSAEVAGDLVVVFKNGSWMPSTATSPPEP